MTERGENRWKGKYMAAVFASLQNIEKLITVEGNIDNEV